MQYQVLDTLGLENGTNEGHFNPAVQRVASKVKSICINSYVYTTKQDGLFDTCPFQVLAAFARRYFVDLSLKYVKPQ